MIRDKLSAGLYDFRNNLQFLLSYDIMMIFVATCVQSSCFKDISLIIYIAYVWMYTHYHFNKSTDDREQTEFLSCWQIHKIFYSVDDSNKQHVGRCLTRKKIPQITINNIMQGSVRHWHVFTILYPCVIKIKTYQPTNTYPKSLKM